MKEHGKTVKANTNRRRISELYLQQWVEELEAELQMKLDVAEWTTEQIQDMHDTLVGSMYNGIKWEL